jgi:hypothetical protein
VLIEFPSNTHVLLIGFCLVVTEPVRHLGGSESSLRWILMGGFRVLEADTVIFGISAGILESLLLPRHRYGCKLRPIGSQ